MLIADEAFNLLCGDLLGEGCSRKVYACALQRATWWALEYLAGRDR